MFNRIIMVGNLTRDLELKYLSSGIAVTKMGLANNRKYKKQDGSEIDKVCFIDVKLFGRTAEIAYEYLKKGSKVLIEGKLDLDTWEDKDGVKKHSYSIIAESMQMLGKRNEIKNEELIKSAENDIKEDEIPFQGEGS